MYENGAETGGPGNDPPSSDDRMDVSEPTVSDKELDSDADDEVDETAGVNGIGLGAGRLQFMRSPGEGSPSSSYSASSSTEKEVQPVSDVLDNQDHNIDNRENSIDNRDNIAGNWDSNVDNRSSNDLPSMSPINRSQADSAANFGMLDLDLPSSGTYHAETVDFPSSPKQMKLLTQRSYEAHGLMLPVGGNEVNSTDTSSTVNTSKMQESSNGSDHKDAVDAESDLEDYYEDYHMPVTHQNVMSRQKSFRRKLLQTPLNEPDADRIESIVKSGELRRHGSIRRRIVPSFQMENSPFDDDGDEEVLRDIDRLESLLKRNGRFCLPRGTSTPNTTQSELPDLSISEVEGSFDRETFNNMLQCFDKKKYETFYNLTGSTLDVLNADELDQLVKECSASGNIPELDSKTARSVAFWSMSSANTTTTSENGGRRRVGIADQFVNRFEPAISVIVEESKPPAESNEGLAEKSPSDICYVMHVSRREYDGDSSIVEGRFIESNGHSSSKKVIRVPTEKESDFVADPTGSSEKDETQKEVILDVSRLDSESKPEHPHGMGRHQKKKIRVSDGILSAADMEDDSLSYLDQSNHVDGDETADFTFDDDTELVTPDIDTPDEMEESILEQMASSLPPPEPIPEYPVAEELAEARSWRRCYIGGTERLIDMKVIDVYKRVLSHGGYLDDGSHNAIIVFSACYLPSRHQPDYEYVMDNLFLYVHTTLDQLVAEDYVLIYLHGAGGSHLMPTFSWLKRCYQLIDRRLRKNLKGLFLVHPTFWLKTLVLMTKPFVSAKFSRKLRFISSLEELGQHVPMCQVAIPDVVRQYDEIRQTLEANK